MLAKKPRASFLDVEERSPRQGRKLDSCLASFGNEAAAGFRENVCITDPGRLGCSYEKPITLQL
jgi:hypothetical protein